VNVSLAIDRLVLALSVLAVSLGIAIATPAVQVLPDVADTTPVVVPAIRAALGTNRPTMHAIRVPDGFIKIDG